MTFMHCSFSRPPHFAHLNGTRRASATKKAVIILRNNFFDTQRDVR